MTLGAAVQRLEKELFPLLQGSEMGRGILEGALHAKEKPITRELAVEMTALCIAIQEYAPDYFHYRIMNWLPRAIWQMNWNDSLDWWARLGIRGFTSENVDSNPMPEDLVVALEVARGLVGIKALSLPDSDNFVG